MPESADLDEMVRNFCKVGPLPKSEVRRRIEAYASSRVAALEQRIAELEAQEDLYALLRGICEDAIDWIATLFHDGVDDPLAHPLTKDMRAKFQIMYEHPLDNKILGKADNLESKAAALARLREVKG